MSTVEKSVSQPVSLPGEDGWPPGSGRHSAASAVSPRQSRRSWCAPAATARRLAHAPAVLGRRLDPYRHGVPAVQPGSRRRQLMDHGSMHDRLRAVRIVPAGGARDHARQARRSGPAFPESRAPRWLVRSVQVTAINGTGELDSWVRFACPALRRDSLCGTTLLLWVHVRTAQASCPQTLGLRHPSRHRFFASRRTSGETSQAAPRRR
jgi:hypothetical protein